ASGEEAQQVWAKALSLKPASAVDLASLQLAIPPGVTASVRAAEAKAGASAPRGIEVLISRPALDQSALDLAIVIDDTPAVVSEAPDEMAASATPQNPSSPES